jgi:ABC-type glycerol-3-phosphate transport system substrate-binding protein
LRKDLSRRSGLALTLLVIGILLVSPILSACGAIGPSASAGSGQVTIEYWDWWVTQSPTIDKEIKLFEQKYPHIKVKKTTQVFDRYTELLQLAIKGGTAPDVFLIPDKPNLVDQVKLGWLMPLNKWATKEWQAQFPAEAFAEGSNVFDGKIYTVPYEGSVPWLQFYVNTKVFRDAGLVDENGDVKVPRTWDEVREAARTITQKSGGKVYGYGFGDKQKQFLPRQMMMVQNSGHPDAQTGFDLREGRYTWASNPVFLDWITFFMGMKEDGSIIPNAMSMDDEMARVAFAQGKFGMLVGGVWNQSGWQKTNPDFDDYIVAPLPYQGPEQASYFYRSPGGKGFAISSQTKHPEEAWLWFEWLNSREASERWVQDGQGLRVYPEVNKTENAKSPQFKQYMELAKGVRLAPAPSLEHPEMTEVKEIGRAHV